MNEQWMVHDSYDTRFRNPFGAVPAGQSVTLRLQVREPEAPEVVLLRIGKDGAQMQDIQMQPVWSTDGKTMFEAVISAPVEPGWLWYYFLCQKDGHTFYYGNNSSEYGGRGDISHRVPPPYQITVYRHGAATPSWFKESVMYQIFVDRFYNGCEDGAVLQPKKECLLHGQWNNTPLYIRDPKTNRVIRWDFYGGNLYGVKKKLPYLQSLGVNVIYLNPIFEAPSSHKYDTADYHQVDPMFGSNALFQELCREAETFGISIILDGVFSHTGSDSLYFNKEGSYPAVGAYQSKDSPYYKWYCFKSYPNEYDCWWGVDVLPNVNEEEPSYRDFIIHGEDSVLKHWQRLGAKGWRLDVADELPDSFIQQFRAVMKQQDENSILIGEVWEDASNKISYGERRGYLLGDELDSVMNYPFRRIALDFVLGHCDAGAAHAALMSLYENYPPHHFYSLMNLIGSHDVPRVLSALAEAIPLDFPAEEKEAIPLKRLKLLTLWQMTFPGVPCVYYGDEAGMTGGDDPMNRGPYPWGCENNDLLAWYRTVIGLRNRYDVLGTGEWFSFALENNVYGYVRSITDGCDRFGRPKQDNTALLLFNRDLVKECTVTVDCGAWGIERLYDVLDNEREVKVAGGILRLSLRPLEGKILAQNVQR